MSKAKRAHKGKHARSAATVQSANMLRAASKSPSQGPFGRHPNELADNIKAFGPLRCPIDAPSIFNGDLTIWTAPVKRGPPPTVTKARRATRCLTTTYHGGIQTYSNDATKKRTKDANVDWCL